LAKEYDGWRDMPLDKEQWVYIWADSVYSGLLGEDEAVRPRYHWLKFPWAKAIPGH